jgi:hypothetical protein
VTDIYLHNYIFSVVDMGLIVFRGSVAKGGKDRYGRDRYMIYIPTKFSEKVKELYGKEVVVMVIDGD